MLSEATKGQKRGWRLLGAGLGVRSPKPLRPSVGRECEGRHLQEKTLA